MLPKAIGTFLLLITLAACTAPARTDEMPTLDVPPGAPPTLDGVLSPGEWADALQVPFSDGGQLFLMHADGYLYLGIRANIDDVTASNVCVDWGSEIAILHSSAALGTAIYEHAGDGWELTREFSWTLRDTSNSAAAQERREAFLQEENWLASLGTMGSPEEIEFQIAMPTGSLRLAVTYLVPPEYDSEAWWPAESSDACWNVEMLQGNGSEPLQFALESWMTVTEKSVP